MAQADYTGWIVRSGAGHDRGELFCVVGAEEGGQRLLLCDGKTRRLAKPKRKKPAHVTALAPCDDPAIQKLREGTLPSNKELRRALAAFRAEHKEG